MFLHQYFLATRVDVRWNVSAWKEKYSMVVNWNPEKVFSVIEILTDACRSSVLPIRSSNLSPLSSTLLMLSFRITLTSLTWPCTCSSWDEAYVGGWEFVSACEKWGGKNLMNRRCWCHQSISINGNGLQTTVCRPDVGAVTHMLILKTRRALKSYISVHLTILTTPQRKYLSPSGSEATILPQSNQEQKWLW